jgi:hypothetical protein
LHAEHARKCLKVEYGRIEYDFQKARVTGPWDHKVLVSAKKVKKKKNPLFLDAKLQELIYSPLHA